jgi:dipeptidyl aminopeptidase/acylaminoacyl peptidase
MRADGSGARPLIVCPPGGAYLGSSSPAFSPDGRLIAVSRDQSEADGVNYNGIFTTWSDGTHLRRVTARGPDAGPDNPHFSPDGKQLVFDREDSDGRTHLMLAHTDGTHIHPLLPDVEAFTPDWSPVGDRIAFSLVRHSGDTVTVDIATVRVDGTHLQFVTHHLPQVGAYQPNYSPHGGRLVFADIDASGCGLVIATTDGSQRKALPTGAGCTLNPSWA